MTRVAAFDCGTNSLRLLVADASEGVLRDLRRENRIVRLGQGVDATGRFAQEALERTFAVCEEYAEIVAELQPDRMRFIATSASRDAGNREEFFAGVLARLGTPVEVITGDQEAQLSFRGAASAAPDGEPTLVMDLGGGSTELVLGTAAAEQQHSMDIGCVRLTERHLRSDPPTQAEIAAAVADIDAAFAAAQEKVEVSRARHLVGVAGTITTITAAALELDSYDPTVIHGAQLAPEQVEETAQRLLHMTRADRARLPYMHPGRVDVIGAGALVYARLVHRISTLVEDSGGHLQIRTSEADILDGVALTLAEPL